MVWSDVGWGQCDRNLIKNYNFVMGEPCTLSGSNGSGSFIDGCVDEWFGPTGTPHHVVLVDLNNGNYDCSIIPVPPPAYDGSEIPCIGNSETVCQIVPVIEDPYIQYTFSLDVNGLICGDFSIVDFFGEILLTKNAYNYMSYINWFSLQKYSLMNFHITDVTPTNLKTVFTIPPNSGYNQIVFGSDFGNLVNSQGIFTFDNAVLSCETTALTDIEYNITDTSFSFNAVNESQNHDFIEYFWDFGDGNNSNKDMPTHIYDGPGKYTVCLLVINDIGCCGTLCKEIEISCETIPPSFTISGNCPNYYFISGQNEDVASYSWYINNQFISSDENLVYNFTQEGTFRIRLDVESLCEEIKSVSQEITIDCLKPNCIPGCKNIGTKGSTVYLSQLVNGPNPLIPSTMQYFSYSISSQCFNLEGTLVIDLAGVDFKNTTWYCGPGSKIICNDYGILNNINFIDSQLSGCTTMWEGIEAKGNGIPNYYYFTTYIGFYNTTISDAYHAVELSSGRSINTVESRFYNNYIGIYITPTNTHNQVFTNIDNSIFEYTGSMLPPYAGQPNWAQRSYAGIEAYDLVRLYVHGNETNSISLFRNLSYGIKTTRSGVDVYNTTFERTDYNNIMTPNDIYDHYGIYESHPNSFSMISNSTFNGALFTSITSQHGSLNGIKITGNYFDLGDNTALKSGSGIHIYNSNNVNIEIGQYNTFDLKTTSTGVHVNTCNYNTLKMDRNTFLDNNINNVSTVYFNSCTPMGGVGLIRDNIYEGINIDASVYFTNSPKMVVLNNESKQKGIRILQLNSPNGFFRNNSSEVTASGAEFIKSSLSPDSKYCCNSAYAPYQWTFLYPDGGSMNHKLVGNQIRALQLRDATIIGVQPSYGNIFANNSTAQAMNYSGGQAYFLYNQFRVDPNQVGHKPTTVVPAQYKYDWFPELGSSQACGSYDICDSEGYELPLIGEDTLYALQMEMPESEAVDMIANYINAEILFADTLWSYRELHQWDHRVRLYQHIQRSPQINWSTKLSVAGISVSYATVLTPTLVSWAQAASDRDNIYLMTTTERASQHSSHMLMKEKYAQLRTANDSLTVLSLYNDIHTSWATIRSIDSAVTSRANTKIAALATAIDALNTPYLFLSERKAVWKVDMKRMQYGTSAVTKTEWEDMRRIAALCPQEYGSAVYEAMGLLTLYEGSIDALALLNEDCTPSLEERSTKNKLANSAAVYPNPTTGILYIHHAGIPADRIIITDILGQVRYETVLESKVGQTVLDLSHLPAGIYQYSILNGNAVQGQGKVIRIN